MNMEYKIKKDYARANLAVFVATTARIKGDIRLEGIDNGCNCVVNAKSIIGTGYIFTSCKHIRLICNSEIDDEVKTKLIAFIKEDVG
jgi:hypothetical protein